MEGDWDFYFCRVNDALASISVDLDARRSAPDASLPYLFWVFIDMRSPRPDGLSSSEEAPQLNEIEDAVGEALDAAGARFVGRITSGGRRELYAYAASAEGLEDAVVAAMAPYPDYSYRAGDQPDGSWSQYLDLLHPAPADLQKIQNRRVIAALVDHGDPLTVPRPVRHWAYFGSAEQRKTFVDRITGDGFVVSQDDLNDGAPGERPFGVSAERVDPVTEESIDRVVLGLIAIAGECGGEYDGWEAQVIRPRSAEAAGASGWRERVRRLWGRR